MEALAKWCESGERQIFLKLFFEFNAIQSVEKSRQELGLS